MNKLKLHRSHPRKPPFPPPPPHLATKQFNATINSLSSQGCHQQVLLTFTSMLKSHTPPDAFTYPSLLKSCSHLNLYSLGLSLHQQLIVNGYSSDPFTASSLLSFYSKFGNIYDAHKVFDTMPNKNIVPWTAIIGCYSRAGDVNYGFSLYNEMQYDGIKPSSVTIVALLSGVMDIAHVHSLHSCVIKYGYLSSNLSLINCMISVYGKCGRVEYSRKLFETMEEKDIISWNSLISGYGFVGNIGEMWSILCRMRVEGVVPDQQTYTSLVRVIAKEGCFQLGKVVHGQMLTGGLELGAHVETSLIGMYLKWGNVSDAFRIFERARNKDMVLWTSMISGLVQNERADKALEVFLWMLFSGVIPSATTIASALAACAQLNSLRLGTSLHCYVLRRRMELDTPSQNSLITMYAKCGRLEKSFAVFDMMEERDVVSWNAIVVGYAQNAHLDTALSLFNEMRIALQKPDSITVVSLLQACASIGAYHQGKWVHSFVIRSYLGPCIMIDTGLVDMYSKCGNLDAARKCFDRMQQHDLISWSTIISGYGSHGKGDTALEMYSEFSQSGIKPNSVIFLSILYACSHNGLIKQGMNLFESMKNDFGIEPELEHLACMVDLLCRAGRVEDAYNFYKRMFSEPMIDVLGILLDACRRSKNVELADSIAYEMSLLKHEDPGKYVQLAHSYASMAKWDGVGEAWVQMRSLGLKKVPGWSFIELHGTISTFFVGQCSHSQHEDIVSILKNLSREIGDLISTPDQDNLIMDPGII